MGKAEDILTSFEIEQTTQNISVINAIINDANIIPNRKKGVLICKFLKKTPFRNWKIIRDIIEA